MATAAEVEEIKKAKQEVRDLTQTIVGHYKEIERLRDEDRRQWREFSKRMEELEMLKSSRGKKHKKPKGKGGKKKGEKKDSKDATDTSAGTQDETLRVDGTVDVEEEEKEERKEEEEAPVDMTPNSSKVNSSASLPKSKAKTKSSDE